MKHSVLCLFYGIIEQILMSPNIKKTKMINSTDGQFLEKILNM